MKLLKIPFSSTAFVALSKMNQFSVSITDLTVLIPPALNQHRGEVEDHAVLTKPSVQPVPTLDPVS